VYGKCLKLLEENEDVMEYLAILQNHCVCYQKLELFDDVLSTCIRILKLVNSVESKVLGFGGKKEAPVDREELRKVSVRTLMRRANAYVKTGQLYNAKSDFERAIELNQDDEVRKELERLYTQLKSELQG
jgi:tetratricopeptide (TPR) repeat protein